MTLIDKAEALAIVNGYWQSIGGGLPEGPSDEAILDALDAIAERIAALPARGVGVKPLVWDGWVNCHEATATTGHYVVQDEGDEGWGMWTPEQPEDDHPNSFHPTLEAAKAAAQADYEASILAALAPTDAAQAREAALLEAVKAAQNAEITIPLGVGMADGAAIAQRQIVAAILALIGEKRG